MSAPRRGPQRGLTPDQQADMVANAYARPRGQGKGKATAKEGIEQKRTRLARIKTMLATQELSPSARRTSETVAKILEAEIEAADVKRLDELSRRALADDMSPKASA